MIEANPKIKQQLLTLTQRPRPEVEKPRWRPHGISIPRRDVRCLPLVCGYIDEAGKIVTEPRFGYGFAFNERLAWVEGTATMGFIDKSRAVVIEAKFDRVSSFSSGRASIVMNRKYGYIDRKGKVTHCS